MNIAVDARELSGRPTGVGRYLSELVASWSESADAERHDWQLIAHAPPATPVVLRHRLTLLAGSGGTSWEQWTLRRWLSRTRPDVLFAPGYSAPLSAPCPVALTIHDVSFAAHPEWFTVREGRRRRLLASWSARRARLVLTDSQFSAGEIVSHLGISPGRIKVVPLGMRAPLGSRVPGHRDPIILFVGSIFRRRHVDRLIEAFVHRIAVRVPESRLEIVGENRTYPPQNVAQSLDTAPEAIANRVAVHDYVEESTLRELYSRASVCAFLSEYEGFGLTPLEALAAGVAPAVLDTPVAREVYGPAARYIPSLDEDTIADALIDLLINPSARQALLSRAPEVLARYDWRRTAAATLKAIEEAAGA